MTYACTSQEPFQPAAPNALIKGRVRDVRGATSGDELSPGTSASETVYFYIRARERLLEMHKDKKPTFPAAGEKLPLLKKLNNGLHLARKDRNIKN